MFKDKKSLLIKRVSIVAVILACLAVIIIITENITNSNKRKVSSDTEHVSEEAVFLNGKGSDDKEQEDKANELPIEIIDTTIKSSDTAEVSEKADVVTETSVFSEAGSVERTELTEQPTQKSTEGSAEKTTEAATQKPIAEPEEDSTQEPTAEPEEEPTQKPTAEPEEEPTQEPTAEPEKEPTEESSQTPSKDGNETERVPLV